MICRDSIAREDSRKGHPDHHRQLTSSDDGYRQTKGRDIDRLKVGSGRKLLRLNATAGSRFAFLGVMGGASSLFSGALPSFDPSAS